MNIERPKSAQPLPEHAQRVFKGEIFDVYQWPQALYNGTTTMFEKLKRADTVVVIPVTEDGKIILSRQEQPGKPSFVSLLGGRVDEGEEILAAAQRELKEESGFEAQEWQLLYASQPISKIEWAVYTFAAKGCRKTSEQDLDGGEVIDLHYLSFDEFIEAVLDESFYDVGLKMKILEAKLEPAKMAALKSMLLQ